MDKEYRDILVWLGWALILGLTVLISVTLCHADVRGTPAPTPTLLMDCFNEQSAPVLCPPCWADRDGSHTITVDELLLVIEEAVDGCTPGLQCWGDRDANHAITMDELQIVVIETLEGCPLDAEGGGAE